MVISFSHLSNNIFAYSKQGIFAAYGINDNFKIMSKFTLGDINYLMVLEVRLNQK